ncbi:hypothetical protein L6164_034937 [Bauhinia variegata]|uniref:Uncharacterized protein n=1 Tax=Bauhinia variegata TaxID=167791 RepID=A0ACB9KWT5_BAUVA|nr:hypothetical protein L6164_034937 [Bauhinia variegata]
MADLENMLLEAAGRTSSPSRKRHKLPQSRMTPEGSYSEGVSDFREEDSDGDGVASKRPSRSQSHVPLKKRLDSSKRANDHGDQEGGEYDRGSLKDESSDESDVGSDLYKNEDDKQRLAKMTELEREMILSDRASKKVDKQFKEQLRRKRNNAKSNQSRKESPPPASSARVRSSARYAEKTAAKGDVLNELRAKRMKQQNLDAPGKLGNASSSSRKIAPAKQNSSADKASPSSSSESAIRSESDRESSDDGGLDDSDDDKDITDLDMPTFEDIKEITIRRSKLAKWFMEPFFEELIVACFVRIGIGKSDTGPVYRLCMVQSVDASDPKRIYKIENRDTYKHLICVWGSENSAARFQMAVVSDSPPLEQEFNQWRREIRRTCSQMPSKKDVLGKREAIRKTNTYIYSAATVKQMLEEKKSATSKRPLNIAVEKDKLKGQLEIAKIKHDEQEMDRIYKRMEELDATRQARDNDAKAKRLAEMNRKNKVENFKNLSEVKANNANLKAGEEGYDPFSRRWTRSRSYYTTEPREVKEAQEEENAGEESKEKQEKEDVTAEAGEKATAAALQAAADAGKLVDTDAPVDQGTDSNTLHDFELPISLAALEKFGGAQGVRNGFMARKQKLEATVGCRVPENDASRHALTLTISDYKRRRGLL